jgi:hypothetical protein
MKKVYQTIIDKDKGNCMQAAIASLLELELNDVPNFIEHTETRDFSLTMHGFLSDKGYHMCTISRYRHDKTEFLKKVARFDNGVNGFFYASVRSQTFTDATHAVIVDVGLNIVHDPNPNQLALKLIPDDVLDIAVMHDMRIGKTGKLFTREQWDNASSKEQDLNTHKHKVD